MFCHLLACTQDSISKRPVFTNAVATYDFAKSYGVSAGAAIPFRSIIKKEQHGNLQADRCKDEFVSLELGAEHRPFAYTSAYFNVGIGIRFTRSQKHFAELSFEQGVLRTFYDGNVYQEQSDGSIKELPLFGRTYATTGFSYAQNWSISNRDRNAWFIQLRPSLWIQYPYNSFLKAHLSLQAGVGYRLREVTVHSRTKYVHQSGDTLAIQLLFYACRCVLRRARKVSMVCPSTQMKYSGSRITVQICPFV
jgi:hypothetical protein